MLRRIRLSVLMCIGLWTIAILTACGGGGSGSDPVQTSTSPFAVSTAINNLVNNGYSATFTVNGSLDGIKLTGTGTETFTRGSIATFENKAALHVGCQTNYLLSWNGETASLTDTSHGYFDPVSHTQVGAVATEGEYGIAGALNGWPEIAYVGDKGSLGLLTYYTDSAKASIMGRVTITYSIEPDTFTTAILVITSTQLNAANQEVSTESDRYRITPSGDIAWVSRSSKSTFDGVNEEYTLTATHVGPPTIDNIPAPIVPTVPTEPTTPTTPPDPEEPAEPPVPVTPPAPTPLPASSHSVAFQADSAHSGHILFAGALRFPATPTPTWSIKLPGMISYPLVAMGNVYVTTTSPIGGGTQLYAMDVANGKIKWGPVSIPGTYPWSGIAYDGGKIFVINTDGILQALEAATGEKCWSVKLSNQWMFTAPPTAKNGLVYTSGAGSGGTLYAVDASSGGIVWSASVWNGDKSSPAVSNEGVFVTYPCQAYNFNPGDGTRYWNFSNGCEGGGGKTSVYANGKLYMREASVPFSNVVLDVMTGQPIWTFADSTIPAIGENRGYFMYNVYYGRTLTAVDLATRNNLWSFEGDGFLVSAPLVINSTVFAASSAGKVYAVDAATGAQLWNGNAGGQVLSPDEHNVSAPLTGMGAGAGYLVVPAGKVLSAWYLQ